MQNNLHRSTLNIAKYNEGSDMAIELIVKEAKQRDVGRCIARFRLKKLLIKKDTVVEINGKRKTVAFAKDAFSDDDENILRIDGLTRKNAGLSVDSNATIQQIITKDAEIVILAPIDMRLDVDLDFTDFVKDKLLSFPIIEGNNLFVVIDKSAIPFYVASTTPHNIPLRIAKTTKLMIYPDPISIKSQTLDLKTLSRKSWLENLVAVSKATKITFSIEDHEIEEENESKIIETAKKIAGEEAKTVRIELRLTSNGDFIGTLPWIEVDILGRYQSIYPDTSLPPIYPSNQSYEFKSLMRRCFKTGAGYCPKEIGFNPKQIVVAMPFGDDFKDTYVYAIRPALEESGYKSWKADENINNIDIMCKVCQAIQESGNILANISGWNPNVVFELGLAYGLGKNAILIKNKRGDVPVDIRGLEYIEYTTLDDLKKGILLCFKAKSL